MDCRIVGLAQDMNFAENVSQTFVILELPDGTQVRAAVDDAVAEKVVVLQVQSRGAPRHRVQAAAAPSPAAPVSAPAEAAPEGAFVFGGQYIGLGDDADGDEEDEGSEAEDGDEENDDYDLPPAPPEVEAAVAATEAEYNQLTGLDAEGRPRRRSRTGKDKNEKKKARLQQAGQATPGGKRRNLFRTADGKIVAPAKTVPRNEAGFPVVSNGVDPDGLTSGSADEDGVGSI